MKVLYFKVGEDPEYVEIDGSLKSMQELVHGYIEEYPIDINLSIVVNEEGKLNGMKANRWFVYPIMGGDVDGDLLFGDFFVVGVSGDDYRSLKASDNVESLLTDESGYHFEEVHHEV